MNKLRTLGKLAALAAVAALVVHGGAALAQADATAGEVTKIDKAAGKVTLKHAEIKNLDMPPMTMAFRVKDAKVLDSVAVGDRVRFVAEKVDGQYTVTTLTKQP
jgi:Cu(I)/Ag(I) efflux system periplasmic protein CusF